MPIVMMMFITISAIVMCMAVDDFTDDERKVGLSKIPRCDIDGVGEGTVTSKLHERDGR